jgi:hypothetical protein
VKVFVVPGKTKTGSSFGVLERIHPLEITDRRIIRKLAIDFVMPYASSKKRRCLNVMVKPHASISLI